MSSSVSAAENSSLTRTHNLCKIWFLGQTGKSSQSVDVQVGNFLIVETAELVYSKKKKGSQEDISGCDCCIWRPFVRDDLTL